LEWVAEKEAEAETESTLGPREKEFIEASYQESQRREAQREARRQRELETAQKLAETERARATEQEQAARNLRRRAYVLGGVLLLAAALAIVAFVFARQSTDNARIAEENASLAITREAEALEQRSVADEQRAAAEAEARAALEAYSQSLAAHADNALANKDSAAALALALEASALEDPPALTQRMLRQAAYGPGPRRQFQVADLFPDANGRIYSLAMSPTEDVALVGFEDGSLYLWDVETQAIIHSLEGHEGHVRAIAFSPDGRAALSGGSDHSVVLWDLQTGQETRRFKGHDGWVRTVAFSPDGKTAVSGGFSGDSVSSVADPGQLILWDLATGQEIRRFEGHSSGVVAATFAPDGQAILASSGFFTNVDNEKNLILWDVATGAKIWDFAHTGSIDNYALAVSPDGSRALTGTAGNEVILWDLSSGQQLQSFEGHSTLVTSIAYTPDGRRALSGDANGLVILWDPAGGQQLMRTGVQVPQVGGWHATDDPVLNLVASPDGRAALSSAGDGTLVLWDLVDAGETRRLSGHLTPNTIGVAFTPDGKRVLTSEWGDPAYDLGDSNSMRLWDVESGLQLRSFDGHAAAILMIAVSTDGQQAMTASADGTMQLWDLETGEEVRQIAAHSGGVYAVALSPDGRTALSGAYVGDMADSGITLWDLESGQAIQRLLTDVGTITSLAFGADGQTAYVPDLSEQSLHGFAQYDLRTGQVIRRYPTVRCCTDFAIHPDGDSVFLATNDGGPVVEWDLENDREIRTFGQHPGIRTRVEVSPDGRRLLISTMSFEGGTLSLWDLESGQEIRRFEADGFCCFDIDMSPDGTMAISPGGGGTAILWDLTLPVEAEDVRDWIDQNRYVRDLSCEERELYRIEPLCEASE
jgi:WD40 repeat protein